MGTDCLLCGSPSEPLIDLPGLPLTDCREPLGIDQRFLYCEKCGHGQLEVQLSSSVLYGDYSFRTSQSTTARAGMRFFLSKLDRLAECRHFNCVLEVGCNDLHLLKQLRERATIRIGIDPVCSESDEGILLLNSTVEELDLAAVLPAAPDLIICRHTLEHIGDPLKVMRKLIEVCSDDALIMFEVPALEPLVTKGRFDQIFHQHLHYFSLASFLRLISLAGGAYLKYWWNYHYWGSLIVAFRKGKSGLNTQTPFTSADIIRRYKLFRRQMEVTSEYLDLLDGPIYGYGAAQMLPILAYHMDLTGLTAILDDDWAKDDHEKVIHSSKVVLRDVSVLITAVDNVELIMKRLLEDRPRHIIFPFHLI